MNSIVNWRFGIEANPICTLDDLRQGILDGSFVGSIYNNTNLPLLTHYKCGLVSWVCDILRLDI